MATRKSKTSSSKASGKPKPMTPKAGVTRNNNSRRYGCGGKVKK